MRRWTVWLLCVALLLMGGSCAKRQRSAEEILTALQSDVGELPEGQVYRAGAEEGEDSYLSPALCATLYGEEASELFGLMEDYALYLSSFAKPCEIAVFRLRSASDAERVAAMCLRRADSVRVLLRQTEFREMGEAIRVIWKGRTVIMGLTDQPDEWEREALRLARGS